MGTYYKEKAMGVLTPHDIYYDNYREGSLVGFCYDNDRQEDENESIEGVELITVEEIQSLYNVRKDVADKLYKYQSNYLNTFRQELDDVLIKARRYAQIKKYIRSSKYSAGVFAEYVEFSGDEKKFRKTFHPKRKLLISLFWCGFSFIVYTLVIVFGVRITSWFDWFSVVAVAVISLLWLGSTMTVAAGIPRDYRTRKMLSDKMGFEL